MTNILEKIESLKSEKTPNEIEEMLLSGKLGEIWIGTNGYQFVENLALSWLVVEVHRSGFINWMKMHPKEDVVHHKDGNPLNNIYTNLQIMSRSEHSRMHGIAYFADPANTEAIKVKGKAVSNWHADPINAEAVKAINKKHSEWFIDPDNAETIKGKNRKISKTLTAYYADPSNAEAIEAVGKAISKTKRKKWLSLETFKKLFTISEYAKASRISYDTAGHRLRILLNERQISCKKYQINGQWQYNICSTIGGLE